LVPLPLDPERCPATRYLALHLRISDCPEPLRESVVHVHGCECVQFESSDGDRPYAPSPSVDLADGEAEDPLVQLQGGADIVRVENTLNEFTRADNRDPRLTSPFILLVLRNIDYVVEPAFHRQDRVDDAKPPSGGCERRIEELHPHRFVKHLHGRAHAMPSVEEIDEALATIATAVVNHQRVGSRVFHVRDLEFSVKSPRVPFGSGPAAEEVEVLACQRAVSVDVCSEYEDLRGMQICPEGLALPADEHHVCRNVL
jgi:hypothetical protein